MTDATLIGPVPSPELHVMTYNVRRRVLRLGPSSPDLWDSRKPIIRRILAAEQPTLLGVQEALADQVDFVAHSLGPHYRWVGRGRNASGRDERCPVFYDSRRLHLTGWQQRAISTTPDKAGSRSWGNLVRRVVVSAHFTDTQTSARLLVFNTHFDHLSWRSRLQSATFLLNLIEDAGSADPEALTIVTGDFNADTDSAVYRRLLTEGKLRDTWDAAAERLTPQWGTFSNYRRRRPGGKRIDLILVGEGVHVLRTGINAARFDGKAGSDHEPVQAVLRSGSRGAEASLPLTVMP